MSFVKLASLVALLAGAAAVTGCGPDYDRTEITGVVQGGLGGTVDIQHVTVPEGTLVKAHIVSFNSDNEEMANHITSADPAVMEATQVTSDRDYAFLGVKPGQTTITIQANEDTVLILQATVTPQPTP